MDADDYGKNDPISPPVPQDAEQWQDALSMPQGGAPELDSNGVPVHGRSATGSTTLVVTGCLVGAVASALLAIVEGLYHDVSHTFLLIGVIMGLLPAGVVGFAGMWHDKIDDKSRRVLFGAAAVGAIGAVYMMGIADPNALPG